VTEPGSAPTWRGEVRRYHVPQGGLQACAAVIVATCGRQYHGASSSPTESENLAALDRGVVNLERHIAMSTIATACLHGAQPPRGRHDMNPLLIDRIAARLRVIRRPLAHGGRGARAGP